MKKILIAFLLFFFSVSAQAHPKKHHIRTGKHHTKNHTHAKPVKKVIKQTPTSVNVLLVNATDNALLMGTLNGTKMSIASISKLMTIYTVMKHDQDFNEILTVQNSLRNHTTLRKGLRLTRGDLVKLSLVHSDNLAAVTLSENYPGGKEGFVFDMNKNAKELGMQRTVFYEPTGLNANNSSTLGDIVLLTNAVSKFEIFRQAAQTENITVYAMQGTKQIKIKANATSKFFGQEGILTIKTGFTNAAGFCITMLVFTDNKLYNIVILGARSSNERKNIIEKSMQTIHSI
ncbi:MAG: D-alanyl-D-alanine carboxypeptidase family protein [Candidatus Nanopelagicus sp.]